MEEKNMDSLNLKNHMLTTPFQTMKLVIHVAKMQQIMFFVHRLTINLNTPIGNMYYGSVLPVLLSIYQDLKEIH